MKTYLHQTFLTQNNISVDDLCPPLARQVNLFDHICRDVLQTTADDRQMVLKKLDLLDKEIYQHLLDDYDDVLQYNQVTERKAPAPPVSISKDQAILEALYKQGKTHHIPASLLKKKGFSKKLDSFTWGMTIGPYLLEREGLLTISFRLAKQK